MAAGNRAGMRVAALSPGQRRLVGAVASGAAVIALIGFVGSYVAVRRLAAREGFGWFAFVLPIGVDLGIAVFLALDLLMTSLRMPLPLLRQVAWVLTGATIAFNAVSAWPDPLASGMHAVVPLLFLAAVEAARHAVSRMAQIAQGRWMERIRPGRWLLAPTGTFLMWRRRVLWELRSYEDAVHAERQRKIYRVRLRAVYGRGWRRSAPVEALLPLKLARYGVRTPEVELPALPAELVPAAQVAAVAGAASVPGSALATARTPGGTPERADEEGSDGLLEPEPAAGEGTVETAGADVSPGSGPEEEADFPIQEPGQGEIQLAAQAPGVPAAYAEAFAEFVSVRARVPDAQELATWLFEHHGKTGRGGKPLSAHSVRRYLPHLLRQQAEDGTAEATAIY